MDPYGPQFPHDPLAGAKPRKTGGIWYILGGAALALLLSCGCVCGGLIYLGAESPASSAYAGNQVPREYLDTAREVGAMEEGEQILFYYSDAILDVRRGFYFVSDRKVVVYSDTAGEKPLEAIPFDQIDDAEIFRSEGVLTDSVITLRLKDGRTVSFPVSREYDRDEQFYEAILERLPGGHGESHESEHGAGRNDSHEASPDDSHSP